jgi:serine-type D-Ala-D-Ala carboxypeptidase
VTSSAQNALPLKAAFSQQEKRFARAFSILREGIARCAFPGASLAVTYRGELVASQGFGNFIFDPRSPQVHADTVFDVASLTKAIATTTMAMLLYERAKLSLDGLVSKELPDFVNLTPAHQHASRRQVTMRMLLAHSSGLPAYEKLFQFAGRRDELVRAALTAPLIAAPGTRAEYSDIGFIVLGEILSNIAGQPLDIFAWREIFAPLRMTRSRFNPPGEWKDDIPPTEDERSFFGRVMQGEVNDENANVMGGIAGHAGIFAPATDLARFAECMLRGGAPILKQGTIKIFTRRESTPSGTTRALGWDTPSRPESASGTKFSDHSFGHLGFTGTSLWIDPERQLSVTLLTNRTWPDRESHGIREVRPMVHDAIVDALEEK